MKILLLSLALLTATALSAADLTLSWNDNSDNEAGFEVWRKVNDGNWELIGATDADVATFNDAVIPIGAFLTYRVRAWNQFGESGFTNEVMIGTFPPAAPSGLNGQIKQSNSVGVRQDRSRPSTQRHFRGGPATQRQFKGSVRTEVDKHGRLIVSQS